jgi:putative PIN family toxin of toxin-antitoxin system
VTRVCLDSNVLIAAFAARGLCADLLRTVLADFHLVIPQVVVDEVRRVVTDKLKLSSEAHAAIESVFELCEIVPPGNEPSPVEIRDPDDERVLADALAGNAQMLVTGDHDLLSVAGDAPIPILSPRGFVTLVSRGGAL